MMEEHVQILTIRFKEDAFENLSEQLVQSVMSDLLSEDEALRVASDLLTTDQQKFISIEVEDDFRRTD